MTNMRRMTIAIPDPLDQKIIDLKKQNRNFERASYSAVVRAVLEKGLSVIEVDGSGSAQMRARAMPLGLDEAHPT